MNENNWNGLQDLQNLQNPQNRSRVPEQPALRTRDGESLGRYTAKAFLWMFFGLLVTFAVAWAGFAVDLPRRLEHISPYTYLVITGLELVVVLVLSSKVYSLSTGAAWALFFAYSALNGVVVSAWFYRYDLKSMVLVFAVTAVYFGVMAAFGFFTSMDLSRIRTILIGGLIFLIVFGLVSMFIPAFGMLEKVVCIIGMIVFLAFTAYDTQKIKSFYYGFAGDDAMLAKMSIISALVLYLDFINLFLYLLRFLGRNSRSN